MADEGPNHEFGFDDSGLAFMSEDSGPLHENSDAAVNSNDDEATQSFLAEASAWEFEPSPSFDPLDMPSSTSETTHPTYVDPSWQLPLFGQSQAGAAGFDNFTNSGLDPAAVFNFSPASSAGRPSVPSSTNPQYQAVPAMSPTLREKLKNIAMPPHLQYTSPKSASSPESAKSDSKAGSLSSPDGTKGGNKKRKISSDGEADDDADDDDKPIKKTAHNMIEKRYRTNINDKIAALRDSVPSLRIMSKSAKGEDTTGDREELHGLTPAHKLNKATVLSKATEYIRHLEKRNDRLLDENSAMQARITAFEKLFMAGAMNGSISPMPNPPTPTQYYQGSQQQFSASPSDDHAADSAGLINVPEDMKRILTAQMAFGQPYPVPQQPFRTGNTMYRQQRIQQQQQEQVQQNGWSNASPYVGKLMVGSLAGLMILEALREDELDTDKPQGRGLFALPIQLLRQLSHGLDLDIMGYHIHSSLKFLMFLGTILWIFVPSLFATPERSPKKRPVAVLRPAPSLASSIHVRRQAWLTAVQTVWVPRHNFILEACALLLKTFKLSFRNVVGDQGYQIFTGTTQDEERARIKAWCIALDSQLTGGDVEICKTRLVLTLLASGTLPDTPMRLMLKALHIRVLLWDLGNTKLPLGTVNAVAAKLARTRWNEARQMNRLHASLRRTTTIEREDELPDHLAELVELECDEVLSPAVIQRAHSLAFNKHTRIGIHFNIDGMDAVVEDTAISSPMDAVAAWFSIESLHYVLAATLDDNAGEGLTTRAECIELAIKVAPDGSFARNRAILARAVLIRENRGVNIAAAMEAEKKNKTQSPLSTAISTNDNRSHISNADFRLAFRCAVSLAHLEKLEITGTTKPYRLDFLDRIMSSSTASSMSLLGFTAAMQVMNQLNKIRPPADNAEACLEKLAGSLRLWMGGLPGSNCGVDAIIREVVVDKCLTITKELVGMELDTGYGTMSEDEAEGS